MIFGSLVGIVGAGAIRLKREHMNMESKIYSFRGYFYFFQLIFIRV